MSYELLFPSEFYMLRYPVSVVSWPWAQRSYLMPPASSLHQKCFGCFGGAVHSYACGAKSAFENKGGVQSLHNAQWRHFTCERKVEN